MLFSRSILVPCLQLEISRWLKQLRKPIWSDDGSSIWRQDIRTHHVSIYSRNENCSTWWCHRMETWPPFCRRYFQLHFREWKFCSLIKISQRSVPNGPIDKDPALVLIMAWCRIGTSHYLNQCWPDLLTHICGVTSWYVCDLFCQGSKYSLTNWCC